MEVLSAATYGSNTWSSPPAHVAGWDFFLRRSVLLLDRSGGLASRPISHWISFHFNPPHLQPHPHPPAWKHELRLNPQKDRFGLCHQCESIAAQVCFWEDKCPHGAKKQTVIVWKGLKGTANGLITRKHGRCNLIPFAAATRPPTYGWSIPPSSLINVLSSSQTDWRRVNKQARAQMQIRMANTGE